MAQISTKHVQVDKAQSTMLTVVSVAAILTVFSLIACKSLLSQANYQNRVIGLKKQASEQYKKNIEAVNQLVTQYEIFNNEDTNVLGGSRTGSGELDGANGRIVLDALPSKYDFPALTSSLEKIMLTRQASIQTITGIDDEATQNSASNTPSTPQMINFTIGAATSYAGTKDIVSDLERSIRPFVIQQLQLSGKDTTMSMNAIIDTYYQPTKSLTVNYKEVK